MVGGVSIDGGYATGTPSADNLCPVQSPARYMLHSSRLTPGRTFAPAPTVGALSPDLAVWDHKILSWSKSSPNDSARDLAWSYIDLAIIPT